MRIQGLRVIQTRIVESEFVTSGLQLYYDGLNIESYTQSSSHIYDLTSNGFDGKLINDIKYDNRDGSFVMNGSNTYILTPNLYPVFSNDTNYTIEMWLRPTNHGCAVVELGQSDLVKNGWFDNQIEFGPMGYRVGCWSWDSHMVFSGAGPLNPIANSWSQVVLTYQNNILTGYRNTVPAGKIIANRKAPWQQIPLAPSQVSNYYALMFGGGSPTNLQYSSAFWSGRIGVIRVYNRALTQQEITLNFTQLRGRYDIS